MMAQRRERKDHWLPQGYLRGFVGPSRVSKARPLWCFYVDKQRWEEVGPGGIAHGQGFYDYAEGTDYATDNHPDSAFARLEREFPMRRAEMATTNFASWEQHKEFLLEFMQMMRARSPLAMQQQEGEARKARFVTIKEVSPDGRTLKVDSTEWRPLHEHAVRNMTISRMLQDVRAGAAWMTDLNWCLRYTNSENDPFCATDQALFVKGKLPDQPISMSLLSHPDTLLIFPLCWQACLFGSKAKFDKSYDKAHPEQLPSIRSDQKRLANRFVISPVYF